MVKFKLEKYVVGLMLSILIIPTLVIIGLSWMPLKPIELYSLNIVNPKKEVRAGSPIVFELKYKKYTNRSGFVILQLINDRVIFYTPLASNVAMGNASKYGSLKTSIGDMPGVYRIKYTASYEYFGFRQVEESIESEEFTIVN